MYEANKTGAGKEKRFKRESNSLKVIQIISSIFKNRIQDC